MSMLRVHQALPAAPLCATTALLATLAACGGGGMGTSPMSMANSVMGSGSMTSGSMDTSCMGMGMSCPTPTIAIMPPAGTVSRTVTLRAQVNLMQSEMPRVDFMVDGTRVGTTHGETSGVSWDSTTVNDGAHTLTATLSDSLGQTASASPVTIEVDNHPVFTVALSPAQIVPAPASAGSGTAHLSVDLGSGAVSGSVMLSGITATAVTLNAAFAGDSGPALVSVSPGAGGNAWQVPAGALLTADQVTALLQGGLYVMASTAAHPGGELRGQITPTNVMVNFSVMSGAQEVPAVTINAAGVVATTVDTVANTLTVHVHSTGVDDASAADIDDGATGATGPQLAALTKDDIDPGHWSTQLAAVSATDIAAFKASNWYVNVMTPADPQGAIRGQIELR
jgi:hypothetical protein